MQEQLKQPGTPGDDDESPLTISPENVCFIIIKAREFDAKDEVTEPDPGSNPSDDKEIAVLEEHANDPVVQEIASLINSLSEDEQIDLVTLAGWDGVTIRPAIGRQYVKKPRQRTTSAPPNTCLACRS